MMYLPGIIISLITSISFTSADPVLRYNGSSCNSLEPVYVDENWQNGVLTTSDEEDVNLFDIPRRSRQRVPPFEIRIDFDQYRRNRKYKVTVIAAENQYFDSFLLQARGINKPDGNATLVGTFLSPLPSIAMHLDCLDMRDSSVIDRGRPIQLKNMTFMWMSPNTDFGQIRFIASLVFNNEYIVIESRQITFNTFPVSIRGCGRDFSCFRQCGGETNPTCPVDRSNYVSVWSYDPDSQQVVISMGGRIVDTEMKELEEDGKTMNNETSYYIAMGFGMDRKNLKMMDVTACYMKQNSSSVMLEHFYLEDRSAGQLYRHKAPVNIITWDIDTTTGFLWCNFTRPVYPRNIWDLDLSLQLYQFYFIGTMDENGVYMPEDSSNVWDSKRKQNFTKITNAIEYSYSFMGPKSPIKNSANSVKFENAIALSYFVLTILHLF